MNDAYIYSGLDVVKNFVVQIFFTLPLFHILHKILNRCNLLVFSAASNTGPMINKLDLN